MNAKVHSAANNVALARIKALMPTATYREARAIYNTRSRDACRTYMGALFSRESRADCVADLFGELPEAELSWIDP